MTPTRLQESNSVSWAADRSSSAAESGGRMRLTPAVISRGLLRSTVPKRVRKTRVVCAFLCRGVPQPGSASVSITKAVAWYATTCCWSRVRSCLASAR